VDATTITVESVVAGTVAVMCQPVHVTRIKTAHEVALEPTCVGCLVHVACVAASVKYIVTITAPVQHAPAVHAALSAKYADAATATAFLGAPVTARPTLATSRPIVGVPISFLPNCGCDNFRNGLTTDDVGDEGCARDEVHGLRGVKTFCMPPSRPRIPYLDDGCPSDMFRCVVTHVAPTFPDCACSRYDRGAFAGDPNGTCQKIQGGVCIPRNYVGEKKIGGSEYYGCPEDMFRCS